MAVVYKNFKIARRIERESVISQIGNTPLISLSFLSPNPDRIRIYAKAEWHNPGGSVKDRAAANMIIDGIQTGELNSEKIILDATSGNTGISYAMIGANLGYKVRLTLPANANFERKRILSAYGADIVETNAQESTDGAVRAAREIFRENPGKFFYADQYSNSANWRAHYNSTALEIMRQTQSGVTHFVAGLGTTGTFMGTGYRLKEAKSQIKLISAQPDFALHGVEGWKHLDSAEVPSIYNPNLADQNVEISTEEAQDMVRYLAKKQGLLVSVSSGAAAVAAKKIGDQIEEGIIVTVFPDNALKYLSESFWEEK